MSFWSGLWNGIKGVGSSLLGIGGSVVSGVSTAISNKQQLGYQKDLMKLQNQYNTQAAKTSFDYSKKLQDYQNAYTSKMASTAHQIEVNDLRKAGLNPILSATGGSGATVPGAGNGSVTMQGNSGGTAPDVDYLGSALAYRQQKNQNKQTDSLVDLQKAQKGLVNEQENNAYQEGLNLFDTRDYIRQQTADLKNQMKNRDLTTAANVKRLETMNTADLMNALTNRTVGTASAYNSRQQGFYAGSNSRYGFGLWAGDLIRRSIQGKRGFSSKYSN